MLVMVGPVDEKATLPEIVPEVVGNRRPRCRRFAGRQLQGDALAAVDQQPKGSSVPALFFVYDHPRPEPGRGRGCARLAEVHVSPTCGVTGGDRRTYDGTGTFRQT